MVIARATVPRDGDGEERDSPASVRVTGVGFMRGLSP